MLINHTSKGLNNIVEVTMYFRGKIDHFVNMAPEEQRMILDYAKRSWNYNTDIKHTYKCTFGET
jgi:hypothetical protein